MQVETQTPCDKIVKTSCLVLFLSTLVISPNRRFFSHLGGHQISECFLRLPSSFSLCSLIMELQLYLETLENWKIARQKD